jgi:uncharacterized membrane protein (UPF0127 family)
MLKIRFIAKQADELAKGLMFAKPLEIEECAFFIFPQPGEHSFWNKNVDFPISLIYLDENFEVRNIGELKAHQEKPNRSEYPYIKYVIEGHHLLPLEKNITIGDFCIPEENIIKILKGKQKSN